MLKVTYKFHLNLEFFFSVNCDNVATIRLIAVLLNSIASNMSSTTSLANRNICSCDASNNFISPA